jgi:hypothetical protein
MGKAQGADNRHGDLGPSGQKEKTMVTEPRWLWKLRQKVDMVKASAPTTILTYSGEDLIELWVGIQSLVEKKPAPKSLDDARKLAMEWVRAKPGLMKAVADDVLMEYLDSQYKVSRELARRLKDEARIELETQPAHVPTISPGPEPSAGPGE